MTKISSLADFAELSRCPLLVVKVGSSLLVDHKGALRGVWLSALVKDLAALRASGQSVVVVSSGAIALGASRLGLTSRSHRTLAQAQAAAAAGQIALAAAWSERWAAHTTVTGQVLLTLQDLEDRRRYLNAAATLAELLGAGAVPIVNENDTIATDEIRFGDNDRLAARVAQAVGASGLILLTDVDGLYDRPPEQPGAQRIKTVDAIDDRIKAAASADSGSGLGTGGMASKIAAAEIASRAGIALGIVGGKRGLAESLAQEQGTLVAAGRSGNAFKSWLVARSQVAGSIAIDAGCVAALRDGASVLAAGIETVTGDFKRGDLVTIVDSSGAELARGLAEYDAAECRAIAGCKTSAVEPILGYPPRAAVVHRSAMVVN